MSGEICRKIYFFGILWKIDYVSFCKKIIEIEASDAIEEIKYSFAKYGYDENLTAPILDREHSYGKGEHFYGKEEHSYGKEEQLRRMYELEDKIETVELWYK